MYVENEPKQALEEIKQMMHRGSRFVNLSGWSGVAAGVSALAAAWWATKKYTDYGVTMQDYESIAPVSRTEKLVQLDHELLLLALITFMVSLLFAWLFTILRSQKTGSSLPGYLIRKIVVHIAVPMLVGGLLIWRITDFGLYGLVIPVCLLFYGIALINAAKFTLSEVRYLGYAQIALGLLNLWAIGYGLYFWAMGFGVLHIVYGILMWAKYERNEKADA